MKKIVLSAFAALTLSAGAALAADMPVKAARAPAAPPAWDLAFGSALMNDYIFRGVTQSNHKASVAAYFEPRYNVNPNLQLYLGVAGESISFPNRAAAEIDIYGGVRSTLGKLVLDFGAWYYWYPGGQQFFGATALPNGNVIKGDMSFWEVYFKPTWNVTDAFALGANVFYSPSFMHSGANGTYLSGTAKYTFPALANGVAIYTSGEFGRQWLGTTDSFYAVTGFPNGIKYKDYNTWNLGLGWTYKVFTVDLRYSDTNLSKGDCNAFTSDHTASGAPAITPINPSPAPGSNWCGAAFTAKLSADLTVNSNLK
jgi:uncharacterized protein (TIGR02001 family)